MHPADRATPLCPTEAVAAVVVVVVVLLHTGRIVLPVPCHGKTAAAAALPLLDGRTPLSPPPPPGPLSTLRDPLARQCPRRPLPPVVIGTGAVVVTEVAVAAVVTELAVAVAVVRRMMCHMHTHQHQHQATVIVTSRMQRSLDSGNIHGKANIRHQQTMVDKYRTG